MEQSLSFQAKREVLQRMAPQYRQACASEKRTLLESFVATTGYVRKYARWLLNHAEQVQQTHGRSHLRRYGSDVQHTLFLVWHVANRICAKRLMLFLPALIEALERHEHLHLTEECRRQLLTMSAATADRLLSSQRKLGQRGLSTTRAGTLLKQQIPIRTFQEWNEARPGFLEADLVAHCGTDIEGGYLYTLTLTDIATGWTECLPLLSRSQETVLAALQQARLLFPFPILGIDTDNGGEFINEAVIAYCEQAHISFTRGRPYLKNDQCFVEQKNGAIVRQVVGYDLWWLLAISVRQMSPLRTPSRVSRALRMRQWESRMSMHSPAHLHKGDLYTVHGFLTFLKRLTNMCLQSIQHHFVDWTQPATTSLLLGTVADLARNKSALVAENAFLRQQLMILNRQVKRPACTKADRILLVLLAKMVRTWKQVLLIVQEDDTVTLASSRI